MAPLVTAANIDQHISTDGGTTNIAGIGDVVTFAWNNSASGDNNSDISSVTINLEPFGGSSAQTMYDNGSNGDAVSGDGIYSYAYTIIIGSVNTSVAHGHVTAIDNFGNQTITPDNSFITVDSRLVIVSGGSGSAPFYIPAQLVSSPVISEYSREAALAEVPDINSDKELTLDESAPLPLCASGKLIKRNFVSCIYCGANGKRSRYSRTKVFIRVGIRIFLLSKKFPIQHSHKYRSRQTLLIDQG